MKALFIFPLERIILLLPISRIFSLLLSIINMLHLFFIPLQMVVFKYIEDKDVFQKFYSKMLAKRLVQHMSASDDAEASMISKLKSACGFEYTNKLQRMFQDQGVSKDLNEQFKQHLYNSNEPLDIDFQIQVRKNTTLSILAILVYSNVEILRKIKFFLSFEFFIAYLST